MIEITTQNFLKKMGVTSFLERPSVVPSRFVLIEKMGSAKKNHIEVATIAFQSYAETLYEAANLNELLKRHVENMVELEEIAAVKLNSDYNYTNPSTKEYRYQAVFDITFY